MAVLDVLPPQDRRAELGAGSKTHRGRDKPQIQDFKEPTGSRRAHGPKGVEIETRLRDEVPLV